MSSLQDVPRRPGRPERSVGVAAILVKLLGLGLVVALVLSVTPALLAAEDYAILVAMWVAAGALVAVYGTTRLIPLKYLLPGTLFLLAFIVYPIISTFAISFTNFGDGKRTSKEESITQIIGRSVQQLPDSPTYTLTVGTTGSPTEGPFTFFLVDDADGSLYRGTAEGLEPLEEDEVTVTDGRITEAPGFTMLDARQVNDAGPLIQDYTVPTEDGAIRPLGIGRAFEGTTILQYDEDADAITDTSTGRTYPVAMVGDSEYFVDPETGRPAFSQSWQQNVGLANYERVLTNPTIRADFVRIFLWTLAVAVLSVATTFALGLFLAVVLNDPRVRGRRLYRSILLLPYAIPAFISLLVWASFYNRDFGLINDILPGNPNWLGDPWLAKVAVLLTNLWLGFPYMLVVSTGALQAIPAELKEAAAIDGASGFTAFRRITFPLLLVAVGPLLVASFAFNFNNFNLIQLLTEGGPFPADNPQAGHTDILISYTYRLAFGAGGAQFGFAAAVSVVLFVLTAVIATIQFRYTRVLESVS
ncbi:ABC transporter permease subunit [Quadrisphaera sp. GCM10027208]|uniref:ABC transporter permease subunit n=1 Tax=Quadrisphaera sp. GCM10027208 TaxID=3273423 RepID=UPI00361A57D6